MMRSNAVFYILTVGKRVSDSINFLSCDAMFDSDDHFHLLVARFMLCTSSCVLWWFYNLIRWFLGVIFPAADYCPMLWGFCALTCVSHASNVLIGPKCVRVTFFCALLMLEWLSIAKLYVCALVVPFPRMCLYRFFFYIMCAVYCSVGWRTLLVRLGTLFNMVLLFRWLCCHG